MAEMKNVIAVRANGTALTTIANGVGNAHRAATPIIMEIYTLAVANEVQVIAPMSSPRSGTSTLD